MSLGSLIVIGAGPSGIAAALGAISRGWDVTVLERYDVGDSLRFWGGATRFFSPLAMNLPPGAAELLGHRLPPGDAILTGPEFNQRILAPLADSQPLAGRIWTGHKVIAVGRAGLTRAEMAGHPIRAERPFRLLVETRKGESWMEADRVLDASGLCAPHAPVGSGGLFAPGEREFGHLMWRDLRTIHENLRPLEGRRILLIGHGHSAANAIGQLALVAEQDPATQVVWAVRSGNQRPCVEVPSDPLPERQQIVARANALAARPPEWLTMERRASMESFEPGENQTPRISFTGGRVVTAKTVIAFTGYRPNLSILSELAIEIAPATEGAARLARALSNVTDCLAVPKLAPADLDSGEFGFHMAGAKSYGRARTFLLKNGYAQIETILDRLAAPPA